MEDKITFIIKCTRNCNFACSYCTDRRRAAEALDFESIAKLTKDSAITDGLTKVTYIFHGGEPLLLGIDYFRKILGVQSILKPDGRFFQNLLQTNGSLIDDEWCDFFKANGISVGVSFDGAIENQDGHRTYADGRSTFEAVTKGISRLKEKKISFGVLSVASKDLLSHDREKLFRSYLENQVHNFAFLVLRPKRLGFQNTAEAQSFYTERKEYALFLCDMYQVWLDENNERVSVRELSSMLDTLLGGAPHLCIDSGPCVGRFFGVNVSGDVAHCDKFFADPRFQFGNIKQVRLKDMLASETLEKARELETSLKEECRSCDWFDVCQGGCLYEALLFEKSKLKGRIEYCHLRTVYEYVSKNLDALFASQPPHNENLTFA